MFEDAPNEVVTERLAPGLDVVRVPLPVRLEPVNCYVLHGGDAGGLTIVDCGLAVGATGLWSAALAALGAGPGDVERIVVTHLHPDHIGGSAALARLTGAPVFASRVTAEQAPPLWGPGMHEHFALIDDCLLRHGMPRDRIKSLAGESDLVRAAIELPPCIELLDADDVVEGAGTTWRVVLTPGHSDGHLCLLDQQGGRLLAGDHLLERISPAVGRFPGHSDDPLAAYLASLEHTAKLGVHTVLPGHGKPFADGSRRCTELLEHHRKRVAQCVGALGDGPATAHQVALVVFGPQPDPANERFAVTETLAHLEYARRRGGVQRVDGALPVRYAAAASP